jgi:hypothetical protein
MAGRDGGKVERGTLERLRLSPEKPRKLDSEEEVQEGSESQWWKGVPQNVQMTVSSASCSVPCGTMAGHMVYMYLEF